MHGFFMSVDTCKCLSYQLSSAVIQIIDNFQQCFFPSVIEHLDVIVVQLHIELQGHSMCQSFIDVEKREDLAHNLPTRKDRALTLVLCLLQEVGLSLEIVRNDLHDSLDDLRIKSFALHGVLVEHES